MMSYDEDDHIPDNSDIKVLVSRSSQDNLFPLDTSADGDNSNTVLPDTSGTSCPSSHSQNTLTVPTRHSLRQKPTVETAKNLPVPPPELKCTKPHVLISPLCRFPPSS